jgi:rhodanese-related sulfurtransferase
MTDKTDEPFVDPDALRDKLARGEPVVIVDVRSAQEFLAGHVDGAVGAVTATSLAENNC